MTLKPKATILTAHGALDALPFEVKSRHILTYEAGGEPQESYRQTLVTTLSTIINEQQSLFDDEFQLMLDLFADSGKDTDLYFLLGLSKTTHPISATQAIKVEGHNNRAKSIGSALSAISTLKPFFRRDYIKLGGDNIEVTKKGRAFCEYVEEHGYVVDRLNDELFIPGHRPFHEQLSEQQRTHNTGQAE